YRAEDCPLKDKGPEHVDFVVVRENNEGLYTGAGGFLFKGTPHEVAIQESVNTRRGVERCLKYAFELAGKRRNGKPWKGLKPEDVAAGKTAQLTLCGKTNVLTYAFDLWWRTFQELAPNYPAVKSDYAHVDAICMWFVKNPEWFDVIVTDNMFGDIITDLAAMIQGGLGVAAGGNINPEGTSMFEPMGGSAPKYTGQNVINPLAAINAGAMMLDFLGESQAATAIEDAVIQIINTKVKSLAAGRMGYGTREIGDLVAEAVA
ncbi:MAG TPA: isocitrate/isopropylmalate family dehydrogenase, partial [Verrucomicrobiota bacterium]|nr:isocitrate/isopropylmalate family dehydrogenase [Verrucomicrobiota bacterium]